MKSIIDYTNKIKAYAAAAKSIAPVENGTAAAGSYGIGENFMREGVLYKAKTAITAGDTLTLNTNYELDDPESVQIGNLKQALSNEVSARAELGAHQLIVFPYVNGNGHVSGNVTFTVDDDGIISATSTGTPNGWFNCMSLKAISETSFKIGETYTLSGGESGITLYLDIRNSSNTSVLSKNTSGTPVDFTIPNDAAYISVFINVDTAVSSKKIKPLITVVSDTNREFTPYAMTNRELTEQFAGWKTVTSFVDNCFSGVLKYKETKDSVFIMFSGQFTNDLPALTVKTLCQLPFSIGYQMRLKPTFTNGYKVLDYPIQFVLFANGTIQYFTNTATTASNEGVYFTMVVPKNA